MRSVRPWVVVWLGLAIDPLCEVLRRCGHPSGVRLHPGPLDQVRVVQLERRALGADARQLGEVVPRRRAARGPLQRVPEPPWVVDGHDAAEAVAAEYVPDE